MPAELDQPLTVMHRRADPAWNDFNGHMNAAAYAQLFDEGLNLFLETIGLGATYTKAQGGSVFVVQTNISYQREILAGDCLRIDLQIVDRDDRSLHLFFRLFNETKGLQAATAEMMTIHVSMETRRMAPFPDIAVEAIEKITDAHKRIPKPAEIGRAIHIRHRAGKA